MKTLIEFITSSDRI